MHIYLLIKGMTVLGTIISPKDTIIADLTATLDNTIGLAATVGRFSTIQCRRTATGIHVVSIDTAADSRTSIRYYYRNRIYVGLGSYRPYYDSYGYQLYYYGTYPETSQRVTNNYYGYPYEKQPKAVDSVTPGYDSFTDSYPKPQQNTRAGIYFDKGISEFITGRYEQAAKDFKQASRYDPESPFLSFAHIQALVAGGYYYEASQFLQTSLDKLSPQNEGVFFPRGLYSADALLNEHIEKLRKITADNPGRTELQLLLGYQLLGIGEYDEALENLQKIERSYTNKEAASKLIEILQKVRN